MEFVRVPEGCYQMGSNEGDNDEKPVHEVCVDSFWLGKYEVTQGQWKKVMGSNPSEFKKGDDFPVENVALEDVTKYILVLNGTDRAQFRLPTEAEWEYACRSGGKDEIWSGTSTKSQIDDYGNTCDGGNCAYDWKESGLNDSYEHTAPVGRFSTNGLGLNDMTGNVWEWVQDEYDENAYRSHSRNNPVNTGDGSRQVYRGGSWVDDTGDARCADRRYAPDYNNRRMGFRLLRK